MRLHAMLAAVGIVALSAAGWVAAQSQKKDVAQDIKLIPSIQGPELYKAYCASCHGLDAKGNGPVASALKVRPSDLTRIAIRNGGTFPSQRIQKVILGEQAPGGHGNAEMPVWGPIFSQVGNDVDLGRVRVDNLARYLRGIQAMK